MHVFWPVAITDGAAHSKNFEARSAAAPACSVLHEQERARMNHATTLKVSCAEHVDPDATPVTPLLVEYEDEVDRPAAPRVAPTHVEASTRHDTPLLPAAFPARTELRATLTVLTGLQAGRIVAVDGEPMTIGRGADADLVVEDTGV